MKHDYICNGYYEVHTEIVNRKLKQQFREAQAQSCLKVQDVRAAFLAATEVSEGLLRNTLLGHDGISSPVNLRARPSPGQTRSPSV